MHGQVLVAGGGGAAGGVSVGGGQGCPMPGPADSALDPMQDTAEPSAKLAELCASTFTKGQKTPESKRERREQRNNRGNPKVREGRRRCSTVLEQKPLTQPVEDPLLE